MSTCLAVIPARGGSRGIPHKNVVPLAGRPLIAWTIDAALGAHGVSRVIVSSDATGVLVTARRYGAEALRRPTNLATDEAASEPVVAHCLDLLLRTEGFVPDVVALLQPTSPLRTSYDVDIALELMLDSGADAVISVCEPAHSPYKCFRVTDEGFLRGLVDEESPFRRRQDLPQALMPNGAIYAIRTAAFRRSGRLLVPRTLPYEMPLERSLDIDTVDDLHHAEGLLQPARAS